MSGLTHNWRVIRDALKADRERRRAHRTSEEPAFLPAALEVIETLVSPTGRRTSWALLALLVMTIAWLVVGRVDVVATAPGKILTSGNVKMVESAESGVITAIHVRDGDRVRRGQLLVELDTTLSSAELEQARKAWLAAELDVARGKALVDALDGRGINFSPPAETPADVAATQLHLIQVQVGEVNATVSSLGAGRASALADARAAAATRRKLDDTLPLLGHELEAMQRLDARGYAPGMRLLDLQRQHRSEQGDRDVAAAQEQRAASEARRLGEQITQTREQARHQALLDLAKAEADAAVKREEVVKASRRKGLQRLLSPADGSVQQLAVHTVSGVIEPARPLMVVVPTSDQIEVEAHILNKDIGFVHEGQPAAVKIEAFPFTRYGTVPGRVTSISRDAVADPKLGSTYIARILLDRSFIIADGRKVPLSSGLGITADIRTGSRRIISWLLSPVQTTIAQAGQER